MVKFSKKKHEEEAERYRDRIGDRLFNPDRVDPDKKHLIQDDIQRVNRVLQLPCGKIVLDVGCSDGSVTIEIAKKWLPEKIVGVDIAGSAIREAKERKRKLEPFLRKRISFLKKFIEDLNFPDDYFDTIYACETLEHIAQGRLEIAVDNLVRMLKKEGNMIVTVPNRDPAEKYVKENRARWDWPTHYRYFYLHTLKDFLSRYFTNIEFFPLYDDEQPSESIYLICNCTGKK